MFKRKLKYQAFSIVLVALVGVAALFFMNNFAPSSMLPVEELDSGLGMNTEHTVHVIDEVPKETNEPASDVTQPQTEADMPVYTQPSSSMFNSMDDKEYGTWIWESPIQLGYTRAAQMLEYAAKEKFNVVYITIDDYLAVDALSAGQTKDTRKKQYFAALNQIVVKAGELNIEVDVEGGWKDWGDPKNTWKGYALIDFVKEYNDLYPRAKVRGLQYDVEPYLLATYEKNQSSVLLPFIEFIDESTTQMEKMDAKFSIVIPHFYDSAQKWTPTLTYKGEEAFPFTHLLNILDRKDGSSIIIMSYRNFFEGKDGVEELSVPELKEASTKGHSTKIIIAQETGDVSPDYVTFYGLPKEDLSYQLSTIHSSFAKYNSFGGSAVHYLDTYLELE